MQIATTPEALLRVRYAGMATGLQRALDILGVDGATVDDREEIERELGRVAERAGVQYEGYVEAAV